MKLIKRRRLAAHYSGARSAWLDADGDIVAAEAAVRANPAKYGFDPMTIMAIIQIISLLWQLWQKHKVSHPPETLSEFEINYREANAFEGITFDDDHE